MKLPRSLSSNSRASISPSLNLLIPRLALAFFGRTTSSDKTTSNRSGHKKTAGLLLPTPASLDGQRAPPDGRRAGAHLLSHCGHDILTLPGETSTAGAGGASPLQMRSLHDLTCVFAIDPVLRLPNLKLSAELESAAVMGNVPFFSCRDLPQRRLRLFHNHRTRAQTLRF